MCLTALLNVGAKISIKPSFMFFFSVHSAVVDYSAVVNNSE